ncbi:unnamed protein product [Arabidopsis halleri]
MNMVPIQRDWLELFGYMAPEYVTKESASNESDIYRFGIILLEIVTGRKSLERTQEDNSDSESNEKSIVEKVLKLYGKQEVMTSCVDEKLGNEFDNKEAECLLTFDKTSDTKACCYVLHLNYDFFFFFSLG